MPDMHDEYIADLLDLLANRDNRVRRQHRVPGPDGLRIIEEEIDETGLGDNNETDNLVILQDYLLDCNHPARGNLGGRCHFCDALVCRACIFRCASCGLATCPPHTVMANFTGTLNTYCHYCADEIRRSLRFRSIVRVILSFFIAPSNDRRGPRRK